MIVLKILLSQDSAGALHAEFIDGLNSVSQNNASKNIVKVVLDGFELQTEEMLQIAYATSLNENDPNTENVGFNFMEKSFESNSWLAEIDPLVLDRRGSWHLGLRVVTETDGVIQTVSNETEMLEFTVNATIQDKNGNYPTKADVSALYQTAVNAVAQSKNVATETATQVASEVAEELGALIKGLVSQKDFDDLVNSKGQPNGVATLNNEGIIPPEQLPPLDYLPITGGVVNGSVTANEFLINDADEVTKYQAHSIQEGLNTYQFRGKSGTFALLSDLEPIETTANLAMQALYQASIVYNPTTEDTYNERITAEGVNVVDGSEAVLQKVVGSTVRCENLIPYPYVDKTQELNGVILTVNDDRSVKIQGTATASIQFRVFLGKLPIGQYTLSSNAVEIGENSDSYGKLILRVSKNNAWYAEGKTVTFSVENETDVFGIYYYVNIGDTVNVTIRPMLNEGSTAKPYQPYFTGLKSASFAGIESGGRNLFNGKFYNGAWSVSTGNRFSAPQYVCNAEKIPVIGNTNYYLSYKNTGTEYIQAVLYYNKNGSLISTSSGSNSLIITTPADCAFICFNILIKDISGNSFIGDSIGTVMLNHGSTALPYTPYIEPTVFDFPKTPTPMGTTIDFENKKIIEGSREIKFNGEEIWVAQQLDDAGYYRFICYLYTTDYRVYQNFDTVNCVSSVYPAKASNETWVRVQGVSAQGISFSQSDSIAGAIEIYDEAYATKTVEEFKAHLAELYASGNPVTVRYLLATPTERDFTEEQKVAGKKYLVQAFGTESVRENDGKEYGADNTLTQDYIAIKE